MKALLKTKEQLQAEGWKQGAYKHPNSAFHRMGWYLGPSRYPDAALSEFEASRLCGKEVLIIDAQLKGESPRFEVQLIDYVTWISWRLFAVEPGVEMPTFCRPIRQEVRVLDHGTVILYPELGYMEADCGFRKMRFDRARELLEKVAPLLGYEVRSNLKPLKPRKR